MHTLLSIFHINSVYHFAWVELASNSQSGSRSKIAATATLYGKISIDPENTHALRQHIEASVQAINVVQGTPSSQTSPPNSTSSTIFENLGRILFGRFIPLPIQRAIRSLPDNATIQLITNEVELPWELLHDNHDFLAIKYQFSRTPIFEESLSQPITKVSSGLSCLLLGNPTADLPAADEEILAVSDILYTAQPRVNYQLLSRTQVSSTQLTEKLASNEFDLIHYAGHAFDGKLQLADGWFSVDELGKVFHNHPIVLLHACSSASTPVKEITSLADLSAGVESIAGAFMRAGAAAVVGMLWPVSDQAMLHFSQELYSHFVKGMTIGEALRLSRISLQRKDPTGTSWLSPVLYGNPEQVVIPAAPKETSGTILTVKFPEEPVVPMRYKNGRTDLAHDGLLKFNKLIAQSRGTTMHITGTTLYASFGVEQLHENSTQAAIESAKEIQSLAAQWQLKPPAAVLASGQIKVLPLSNKTTVQSSTAPIWVGEAVDEAQQLLDHVAYGEILVNQRGHKQCPMLTDAQPREFFVTETESIVAFTVSQNGSQNGFEYTTVETELLVGRESEQQQLIDLWQKVVDQQGQAVGIAGEAGIGKSHLVRKFERAIAPATDTEEKEVQSRIDICHLTCAVAVQNTPYGLLMLLFRQLLAIKDNADSQEIEDQIVSLYGESAVENGGLAESDLLLLKDLLGDAGSVFQRPEQAVYQSRLYMLLRKLLNHISQHRPLLLVIEDLHWADRSSLDLLTFLVDEIQERRILFLHTYRTNEFKAVPWANSAAFQSIHLNELGVEQRCEFFRQALDLDKLPDLLINFIERRSGNPLFLSEILIALRQRWQPDSDNGFTARQALQSILQELGIPDTIQRAIQMRVGRLQDDDDDARVLKMAAVIEKRCTKELLKINLLMDDERLEQSLRSLVKRNLLRFSWDNDCYEFRHATTREVVYGQIDSAQRQLWHKKVGDYLFDQQTTGNNVSFASITHHYFSSLVADFSANEPTVDPNSAPESIDRTLTYLVRSGRVAMDRYGGAESALYFNRAKLIIEQVASNSALKKDVYSGLGDAHAFNGDKEAACFSYQKAHGLLHHQPLDDKTKPVAAHIARKLGRLYMSQGERVTSQDWFETGVAYVENEHSVESQTAIALLHIHRGAALFSQGLFSEAQDSCRTGLEIAQQCKNRPAKAEGYFLLGAILQSKNEYRSASESLHNALTLEKALQNEYQIHRIEGNLGIICFDTGKWAEAHQYLNQVGTFWEEVRDLDRVASISINLGLLYQYQGEWQKAKKQYAQASEILKTVANKRTETLCHMNQASLAVDQELWDDARQHLDICFEHIEVFGIEDLRAYVLCTYAKIELAVGNISSANGYIKDIEQLPKESMHPTDDAALKRLKGCIAARQNGSGKNSDDAYLYFEESYQLYDQLGDLFEKGRTKYMVAHCLHVHDKRRALSNCNEAIELFDELGAKADLVKTRALLEKIEIISGV